jgi:beta-glucosidase
MPKAMASVACLVVASCVCFTLRVRSGSASQKPETPCPAYLDTSLPVERRVDDLVARMSLTEKTSQMQYAAPAIARLGVPAYNWWSEALHGVARAGYATVFPQAIGLAATWDTDLLHRVAEVISTEARAKYNDAMARGHHDQYAGLTFWSPNINIFRDPRWGRGQETYGEDPFLAARMAVAFVTGMQGEDPRYLKVVATVKHFAVHSGPEVYRHVFDANVSTHDFADTYTPAFRAAVVEGKADSVMCAYNAVRGIPACASPLLYSTLRDAWGFGGYAVSDCGAITDIFQGHAFTGIAEEAAALAVKAGTDLTCGSEYAVLPAAVRDRLISSEEIDRAVKRLFTARFRLGMFDPPESVPWSRLTLADNDTAKHRHLALEAARESIVLLKNDHGVLPIRSGVKTIAVIGPLADSEEVLLGNYNGTPSDFSTILSGIRARFSSAKILSAAGCALTETGALPIPREYFRTGGPHSQPGLQAEFFNGELSGTPVAQYVIADVHYLWNGVAPIAGLVNGERFSARWSGELLPPRDGEYRIGVDAAGAIRLYVDGALLLDDATRHTEGIRTVAITLKAGRAFRVVLEYTGGGPHSWVQLVWNPPGVSDEALEAAKKSEVVIAVVGISPELENEERDVNAPGFFGGDRVDLDLPHPQQQLLEALAATGKPLVVVLTSGSALAVNWAQQHASALLEAWYPGEEGGAAVAEVLAGAYNPAGRLPVTFYSSVGQLPPFTDYSMAGRTYRYFRGTPLYPFGFGLSYSTFAYGPARADRAPVPAGQPVTIRVEIENLGPLAGDEVVELYVTHPGVPDAPIRALAGFERVHLERGEKRTVAVQLGERELSVVDAAGARDIVPGPVEIWIGGGQPSLQQGQAAGAALKIEISGEKLLPM